MVVFWLEINAENQLKMMLGISIYLQIRIFKNYRSIITSNWYISWKYAKMNRNTSISLGSYFDDFIQNRLSTGRYKNASEIVRAGLRLLEDEENKFQSLKSSIQEGLESGLSVDFNPENHLAKLKANMNLNEKVLIQISILGK